MALSIIIKILMKKDKLDLLYNIDYNNVIYVYV